MQNYLSIYDELNEHLHKKNPFHFTRYADFSNNNTKAFDDANKRFGMELSTDQEFYDHRIKESAWIMAGLIHKIRHLSGFEIMEYANPNKRQAFLMSDLLDNPQLKERYKNVYIILWKFPVTYPGMKVGEDSKQPKAAVLKDTSRGNIILDMSFVIPKRYTKDLVGEIERAIKDNMDVLAHEWNHVAQHIDNRFTYDVKPNAGVVSTPEEYFNNDREFESYMISLTQRIRDVVYKPTSMFFDRIVRASKEGNLKNWIEDYYNLSKHLKQEKKEKYDKIVEGLKKEIDEYIRREDPAVLHHRIALAKFKQEVYSVSRTIRNVSLIMGKYGPQMKRFGLKRKTLYSWYHDAIDNTYF